VSKTLMPHHLFYDNTASPPSSRPRRRFLTMFSVAVHAIVVTAIVVIQVFAVGPLPVPHRPLVVEEIRFVHLADIHVPSPLQRAARSVSEGASRDAAPAFEPTGSAGETGLEAPTTNGQSTGMVVGEPGIEDLERIGSTDPVLPPAVAPPAPVRLHLGIEPPRKIADVPPVYPSVARMAHVAGMVILEAVIDARGNVASVQVLRSSPLLDQAAIDAVRQWRYTPALLNGQPVPVVVTITVRFQLQ
jgi:protein TonB